MPGSRSESASNLESAESLLRRVLRIIVIASLVLGIVAAVVGFKKTWFLALVNAAVAGSMLLLVRQGRIRTASVCVVVSLVATAFYAMMTGQGVHDDSLLIFPNAFLLASLLLGGPWVLATVLLSCGGIALIGVAQVQGLWQPIEASRVTYLDLVEINVMLGALAAFAHYVVTLMRRAIRDAREAHQSVKDILDATSEAIFIHDAKDGTILDVNAPTLEMYGATREEFLGQTPFDIRGTGGEFDGAKAAEHLRRAVTEGPQTFEWLAQRKDGERIWVEVGLRCARIANEQRIVAVVRDITDRRELEQQVREAEKLRAVGQLAGGIAHDFNNQLVGIMGNAEFLRSGLADRADLRECAEAVLSSAGRAADLTKQLLAFARKGRRLNVPFDLHHIIREVVTLGKRSVDKRIAIEQRLAATRTVIKGDPGALQNALLNLLLNARDAMPNGGTVTFRTSDGDGEADGVSFEPTLPDARYIIVEVADDGVGIASEVMGRIFEPFFTTKESGTGMGLAAVQGIVLEHQGAIAVESVLGHGATLRLCLPVTDEPVAVQEPRSRPDASRTGGRVLVIDDEVAVARVVALTLQLGGIDADVCNSGQEGLAQYHPNQHELVLLDMMMPDLDGVEVLRRIRQKNPRAKVMLMSGHASDAVEARLQEFPDVTVVTKPFSPLQLLEDVTNRLHEER